MIHVLHHEKDLHLCSHYLIVILLLIVTHIFFAFSDILYSSIMPSFYWSLYCQSFLPISISCEKKQQNQKTKPTKMSEPQFTILLFCDYYLNIFKQQNILQALTFLFPTSTIQMKFLHTCSYLYIKRQKYWTVHSMVLY